VKVALTALVLFACCRRPETDGGAPLPARIGGFEGGPLERDVVATRRAYPRGGTRIEVTLAPFEMSAAQYRDWVRTSTEAFPQAVLDVPAGDGNGFYQCTETNPPRCDLLIQLRAGLHLEIRGGGTSSREDIDEVARGLSLRALAAKAAGAR
jgi:hypothetical protein